MQCSGLNLLGLITFEAIEMPRTSHFLNSNDLLWRSPFWVGGFLSLANISLSFTEPFSSCFPLFYIFQILSQTDGTQKYHLLCKSHNAWEKMVWIHNTVPNVMCCRATSVSCVMSTYLTTEC